MSGGNSPVPESIDEGGGGGGGGASSKLISSSSVPRKIRNHNRIQFFEIVFLNIP